jgi:hypothetical protein
MVPLLVLLLLSSALAFDDLDYDDDDLRNTTTTTLTSTSTTISTTTNQPTERSAEPDITDLRQSFSELEKENEKLEDDRKCLCDVILSRAFSILLDKLHDAENEVVRLVDEKKEEEEKKKKMNREEEKKKRNREELTVEEEKIFRIDDKDFDWFEALETTTTPLPTSPTTTTTSLPTSTSTTVTSTKSSGTTSATTTTVIGQVRIFNALSRTEKNAL